MIMCNYSLMNLRFAHSYYYKIVPTAYITSSRRSHAYHLLFWSIYENIGLSKLGQDRVKCALLPIKVLKIGMV